MVVIKKNTLGDIFGFNDHDFSLVCINCHTHLGAIVMKNLELLVKVIMNFCKKNDIIDIEEKSDPKGSSHMKELCAMLI